jgi:glycerate dehydrogenase
VKLVVLDGHTLNPGDLSWAGLENLVQVEIHPRTPPRLIEERLREADLALTNKVPLDRGVLSRLPRLRYIGVTATGYNVVDAAAAKEHRIVVTNVPAYGTASVAQFTFALLLELCHRIGAHAASAGVDWPKSADWCYWGSPLIELEGKTLGVAGFGRIGRQVARLGNAFGMRILAQDVRRVDAPDYPGFGWVSIEELFREADVVTLHCPLNPETNRLVDARLLALMKKSAFLINAARGQLVAEEDLAAALAAGTLAGAAVDVLPAEPPANGSPLFSAPNCIVTPHIAWATREARERLLATVVENVAAFLAGRPVNVVA